MSDVSLTISDDDKTYKVDADSLSEIARLLKLAGVASEQDSGDSVDDDEEITDENADYDFGRNPTQRKGFVYDVDPYKYQGDAQTPTRYVPAKSADNPLPLYREGRKDFGAYLKDVEDRPHTRKKNKR